MLEKTKARLYDILVETRDGELPDRIIAMFLMALILLNVIAVILETVAEIATRYHALFYWLEAFSVIVFTVEYLLRLWVCTLDPRSRGTVSGRVRYALTPMAMVDLIAILPFYLPAVLPLDLRMARMLRLLRLFRLFKMARYAESLNTFNEVIRNKKEELVISIIVLLILLLFSSSLMYVVESEAQPDKFASIPATMWWSVATLTTVGYGDVFPTTVLGKLLGAFIAILGIGVFALPTGILATGFAEAIQRRRQKEPDPVLCPHCGHEIHQGKEK
jgi:voltage-gated potassium channel